MKRLELIRHIVKEGCTLVREGGRHTVFLNTKNGRSSTVPRHNEIDSFLGKKICRDLDILEIKKK